MNITLHVTDDMMDAYRAIEHKINNPDSHVDVNDCMISLAMPVVAGIMQKLAASKIADALKEDSQ